MLFRKEKLTRNHVPFSVPVPSPPVTELNLALRGPPKAAVMRTPKGNRHDLARPARVAKITAALDPELQAKKRAEYKKTLPPKPVKQGIMPFIKKNAWEKE